MMEKHFKQEPLITLGRISQSTFDIKFLDRNGKWQYVHQTSWGVSTRMIGGLIMVHSDNNGLVMPPKSLQCKLLLVPIAQHKEGVLAKAIELQAHIQKVARVK